MRKAVLEWLRYIDEYRENIDNEFWLLNREAQGIKPPTKPTPLRIAERFRAFNFAHLWRPGGLSNQPHILMAEVETAMRAEDEHKHEKAALAKAKSQLENKRQNEQNGVQ